MNQTRDWTEFMSTLEDMAQRKNAGELEDEGIDDHDEEQEDHREQDTFEKQFVAGGWGNPDDNYLTIHICRAGKRREEDGYSEELAEW